MDETASPAPEPRPDPTSGPASDPLLDPDREHDWFGEPLGRGGRPPRDAVACPRCGEPFWYVEDLRLHLAEGHGHRHRVHRLAPHGRRLRSWAHGLRFMPLWFVLPLNLVLTISLYALWHDQLAMFSFDDQTGVAKAWIVRLSLLPVVLLLSWRVVDKQV